MIHNYHHLLKQYFTCNPLSNHRFPLLHRLPPPCSICRISLWRVSSGFSGFALSKHTVKMLLSMADSDSLFVSSGQNRDKNIHMLLRMAVNKWSKVLHRASGSPAVTHPPGGCCRLCSRRVGTVWWGCPQARWWGVARLHRSSPAARRAGLVSAECRHCYERPAQRAWRTHMNGLWTQQICVCVCIYSM